MTRNEYMVRSRQSPEWHERNRAYLKAWHSRNRLVQNEKRLERYRANKDRHYLVVRANLEKRRLLDPDGEREKMKHRRKRAKAKRRMLNKTQISPLLTLLEWKIIIQVWESRCAYCNHYTPDPTQDHMIPLTRGGEHTISNVVPACITCNQRKSNKPLEVFLAGITPILEVDCESPAC